MTPYTPKELTEVRTIARHGMNQWLRAYRAAKTRLSDPRYNNGEALNDCKQIKPLLKSAADRLKTICYDVKGERPGR